MNIDTQIYNYNYNLQLQPFRDLIIAYKWETDSYFAQLTVSIYLPTPLHK